MIKTEMTKWICRGAFLALANVIVLTAGIGGAAAAEAHGAHGAQRAELKLKITAEQQNALNKIVNKRVTPQFTIHEIKTSATGVLVVLKQQGEMWMVAVDGYDKGDFNYEAQLIKHNVAVKNGEEHIDLSSDNQPWNVRFSSAQVAVGHDEPPLPATITNALKEVGRLLAGILHQPSYID